MTFHTGEHVWSTTQQQTGQVIDSRTTWGQTRYRVWFELLGRVELVAADHLQPIEQAATLTADEIVYRAAAARVATVLTQDVLLAPIDASVIPLPHQLRALSQVMAGDRIRFLLADEVGLGKTIEAGLVMRELKLRGRARRILVVAPKGLVTQWQAEMQTHFDESFQLVIPTNVTTFNPDDNIWQQHDQVICPIDSVKPIEGRSDWTPTQLDDYNRRRFGDLISADWDLIIVDEAHRLGGSSDQVARYQLGLGLADAAPYLLLLSATPHQGKSDAFRRLMGLLDADTFADTDSLQRDRVQTYTVRTAKRQAIDATGNALFQPRHTQLDTVAWNTMLPAQRELYEAVTDYVRKGYNKAVQEKRNYIGFLLLLMQRLVTSSTAAIRVTLKRRLDALLKPQTQLSLFDTFAPDEWAELDGQSQFDVLNLGSLRVLQDEQAEVHWLLQLAERAASTGPDPKTQRLLDWVYQLQRSSGDPDLKMLIFTEFVPTQEMLRDFLEARGYTVATLNGSMNLDQRRDAQTAFAGPVRFLVSTDAGGEGLNLQFCHVVVNYDIPWNPMRLEQRIGRVDRIGQQHPVQAINLVLADTVDARVQEVLAEKLRIILEQFGVDKTEDVLDSAESSQLFDELYREAILHPEVLAQSAERTLQTVRQRAQDEHEQARLLTSGKQLDPAAAKEVMMHPLPRWLEQMVVAFVRANGGSAEPYRDVWDLQWSDGQQERVAFTTTKTGTDRRMSLETPRLHRLIKQLPFFAEGEPITRVRVNDLPHIVRGSWSLWRISIGAGGTDWLQQRIVPIFQNENGRLFRPTAERIWEQLQQGAFTILSSSIDPAALDRARHLIEQIGEPIYVDLVHQFEIQFNNEVDQRQYAFAAQRRAIERFGQSSIQQYRMRELERAEAAWRQTIKIRHQMVPDLTPILLLDVGGAA